MSENGKMDYCPERPSKELLAIWNDMMNLTLELDMAEEDDTDRALEKLYLVKDILEIITNRYWKALESARMVGDVYG